MRTNIKKGINQAFPGLFGLIYEYFPRALSVFSEQPGFVAPEGYAEFKSNNSFEKCAIQDIGFVEMGSIKDKINDFKPQ